MEKIGVAKSPIEEQKDSQIPRIEGHNYILNCELFSEMGLFFVTGMEVFFLMCRHKDKTGNIIDPEKSANLMKEMSYLRYALNSLSEKYQVINIRLSEELVASSQTESQRQAGGDQPKSEQK